MKLQIAIDIETLSTGNNAVVVAVGAVIFDVEKETFFIEDEFYAKVDKDACLSLGLETDPSTLEFWDREENREARKAWEDPEYTHPDRESHPFIFTVVLPPHEVEEAFEDWVTHPAGVFDYPIEDRVVWGNGSNFDNVILKNMFAKASNRGELWNFRNDRDLRTLKDLYEAKLGEEYSYPPRESQLHNALDDAKYQALQIFEMYKEVVKNDTI